MGYSRSHRFLEIASLVAFFACGVILVDRIADGVEEPLDILGIGLSAAGGYIFADFLSGMVHWAGDTLGDETTPVLGKHFVTPFREHHVDPKAITRHDFVETNGNCCILAVPLLLALIWLMPKTTGFGFYLGVVLFSIAFFVLCTNQFHKWAHADRPPRLVRALQRAKLILSPTHHEIHHAPPHDKYYCITTGWLNPLLFRVRFFRACEAVVRWIYPSFLYLERPTKERN